MLRWAALMHDIGKIGIARKSSTSQASSVPKEVAMFQTHPAKGRKRILEPIPFMVDLVPGAFCHHESWDDQLSQTLMGKHSRSDWIVAIADSYDAMTSDRTY